MTIQVGGAAATSGQLVTLRGDLSVAPSFGTVANQAAMLALSTATSGSTCYRPDTSTSWLLKETPPSNIDNWQEIGAPTSGGEGAPVSITLSTTLTSLAHANRRLEVSSGSPINIDMPAAPTAGSKYFGINLGAGAITLRTNGGGVLAGDPLLPLTVAQYSPFEVWYTSIGFIRVA